MVRRRTFNILVASDGSAAGKAAVTTAVRFPWPDGVAGFGVVAKRVPSSYQRSILLVDRTADAVARAVTHAMSPRWPDAQVRVVNDFPVEAILRVAVGRRADVIVLGWRGHGPVRRFLTGSVSRSVVRRAPCAVLVVRRALRNVRHIVVGFDSSPHARRAVELISSLNPPRGSRVTVLTAVDTMHVPSPALVPPDTRAAVSAEVARINKERLARAHQALDRETRTLSRAGWKVDRIVTTSEPPRDLLAAVVSKRADLLVVGARGVTGVRRLLMGSVAEGALNRSPVPVFIVR